MNSRYELFDNSQKCIFERRNLKVKVKKLTNECIINNCSDYLKKMNKLNFFEINNEKNINNAIKLGMNFHFNKNNYNKINRHLKIINNSLIDENNKFEQYYKYFCDTIEKDFSINELEAIKNDQLYYIPNIHIRSNLQLNKKTNLGKDENKKLNILQINKTVYGKFCRRDNNNNQKILKNIKIVKNIIKSGIDKLKNEEKKKIMKKEKIKKLIDEFHTKSKKEVYSLINDKSYKSIFNTIDEESFLRDYNKKRYNSISGKDFQKNNQSMINKTPNNKFINKSFNKKINYFPRISKHSLIKEKKNYIRNKILYPYVKRKKSSIYSLKLSRNFLNHNSSFSLIDSKEDLKKKRYEENLEYEKIVKEFNNLMINRIKANYAKNNALKSKLK